MRILAVKNKTMISQAMISYFNTTAIPGQSSFFLESTLDYTGPVIGALVQASLLRTHDMRNSPVDQWNNVKIPRLVELSAFREAARGNPWIAINQTANTSWSCLSGIMIQGLPPTGISTFTLDSSYIDLAWCNKTELNDTLLNSNPETYTKNFLMGLSLHNTSNPYLIPDLLGRGNANSSFFLDSRSLRDPPKKDFKMPINLIYGSKPWMKTMPSTDDPKMINIFNCTLGISRVESNVTCQGDSCSVKHMRRSEKDTLFPHVSPFKRAEYANLLLFLPFATSVGDLSRESPVDAYILGSKSPVLEGSLGRNFNHLTGQVFAQRMTTILNTFWQASLAPYDITAGPTANGTSSRFSRTDTGITIHKEVPVYITNRLFTNIFLLTSLVLQACAITGLVLKYTATAPDILGYISTMTRDNKYTKVPNGGNALDGLDRARHLAQMRVQLADVSSDQPYGHMVFKSVKSKEECEKGRLRRRRLYV